MHHRFFVAASPDERLGNRVVLVIEGVQLSSESIRTCLEELKGAVSPYEFPKEVYTIPDFVMTESHKVDRGKSLTAATLFTGPK